MIEVPVLPSRSNEMLRCRMEDAHAGSRARRAVVDRLLGCGPELKLDRRGVEGGDEAARSGWQSAVTLSVATRPLWCYRLNKTWTHPLPAGSKVRGREVKWQPARPGR